MSQRASNYVQLIKFAILRRKIGLIQRIGVVAVVLGMVFISFLIVYSENGLKDLLALYRQEERICETNRQLGAENRKLVRQVKRLKQDMDYIEHLARHELGMAGREELVFKSRKNRLPQKEHHETSHP